MHLIGLTFGFVASYLYFFKVLCFWTWKSFMQMAIAFQLMKYLTIVVIKMLEQLIVLNNNDRPSVGDSMYRRFNDICF